MLRHMIWVLWCWLLLAMPAMAQSYEEIKQKVLEKESSAIEWLIAGIFLVGCMVVAFKPAKRSNLG
ncbi:MAG: hypothetical protein JSV03_17465 [Planctomycetota bacterium]|nr:MAG: hypothetical protein JSV03_17465 [Planctomycetota bacterium]